MVAPRLGIFGYSVYDDENDDKNDENIWIIVDETKTKRKPRQETRTK